jgi:PhnB protein
VNLEAYLFFPGNTEEAMNFYQSVLGGELSITHRGDVDPTAPRDEAHLVINAALDTGSFTMRASDRSDATNEVQTRIELTVIGTDESDLRRIFDGLGIGGVVKAPMEKMFWGDIFGALIDKFGIGWQVNVTSN